MADDSRRDLGRAGPQDATGPEGRPAAGPRARPSDPGAARTPAGETEGPARTGGDAAGGSTVEPLWTVGAVAAEVGVPSPTLRSWDRRYGVGPTARTEGRHRRYSAADVRRVHLVSLLNAHGVPASSAAATVISLTDDQVAERLGVDRVAGTSPGRADGSAPSVTAGGTLRSASVASTAPIPGLAGDPASWGSVDAICSAVRALDGRLLSQHFRQALRRDDLVGAWTAVLAPALERIGEMWTEGVIGVDAEHLSSEVLGEELRAVTRSLRTRTSRPRVLLASADEDQHHLPLLALEAELARRGIGSRMLGPRVPAGALLQAVRTTSSAVVFSWASIARPDPDPFWEALSDHTEPLSVVIGGPGWPGRMPGRHQRGVTAVRVNDFASAVVALGHAAHRGS